MTQKKYKVGIVGLSGITTGIDGALEKSNIGQDGQSPLKRKLITSHSACLSLMGNVEVVGYCDLADDRIDNFKNTWGNVWPSAKPFYDYKEMLNSENIDILTVATGDDKHSQIVIDGANSGVKGIFCEKPLATKVEDCNEMLKACEDNGVYISVGHTRRWLPLYNKVREVIRSGSIGKLRTIEAFHGGARAMMFRNGTHIIDGICFFAESEPSKVVGVLEDGFDDWDEYKGDGGKLPENDPSVSGIILFENGIRGFYNAIKESYPSAPSLRITGSSGQIEFSLQGGSALMTIANPVTNESSVQQIHPDSFQTANYVAGYEEMITLIENGGVGIGPGEQAKWVVQILVGFLDSQNQGSKLVKVRK